MENKIPEKMLGMKLPGGAKVQAVEVMCRIRDRDRCS